jgi:DNA polymerase sigma
MVISFLQRHPKVGAGHIRAEDNLGAMLIEILELYGTRFNFDRVGIAIDGSGSYFEKLEYQIGNQHIWKRICIKDPNDPTNNIAKASHQADRIIQVFGDAFRELTSRCYIIHTRIKDGEEAPWRTKSGSILDAIIERPHLEVRERLKKVWKEMEQSNGIPQSEEKTAPKIRPSVTKPNRRQRRATQKEQQDHRSYKARKAKSEEDRTRKEKNRKDSQLPPLSSRISLTSRPKAASGTKDVPIIVDDM